MQRYRFSEKHARRQSGYAYNSKGGNGRSTGGLSNRPPVLKPLSTKAFQKKTGGREVKSAFFLGSFNYYSYLCTVHSDAHIIQPES